MKHVYCLMEKPIPLKRGRLFKLNGKTMVYDSQKREKSKTRHLIFKQHLKKPIKNGDDWISSALSVLTGPLKIDVTFYMPMPKSLSKKKRDAMVDTPHIKRPDIDNLEKYILDCLTGCAIIDDSLVYDMHSRKLWSDNPRTELIIETL